ncbi:MAG: PDZ domain-containing protein [Planctomycetota bacterium]|jgi:S1-C subfamily serine protease
MGRFESRELGVTVQTIVLGEQGLDSGGVLVVAVEPDGFADSVGIRFRDVILALGDRAIDDVDDFRRAVEDFDVEAPVQFRIRRGGRIFELIVE